VKEIFSLFVLGMLIILGFSAIVGAVMFCVDIWKWSKRPEKFTTMEEDLSKSKETVTHPDGTSEFSVDFKEEKEDDFDEWS
jgi:hypothetical protein